MSRNRSGRSVESVDADLSDHIGVGRRRDRANGPPPECPALANVAKNVVQGPPPPVFRSLFVRHLFAPGAFTSHANAWPDQKNQSAISHPARRRVRQMEAPPLERKLVAILAAVVARYSRLMEIDEEGTLATLTAFRAVSDALISRHGRRICGTGGDSILASFGSALAAVQCAVDIQNELAESNDALPQDRRMQFRIGINVGDVMLKEGDIFGDG